LKGDRKPGARLAIIVESNKMTIARPATLAARMMNAAKWNLDTCGFEVIVASDIALIV
jgi:alpha-glucosidase (family GH31 glycosyl hydrolase)